MRPTARLRLLGQFDLRVDGRTTTSPESTRAESLLAYLLLHQGTPTARQRLAFLLWPDSTEGQARTNLRHLLHTLRARAPEIDRCLVITHRTIGWRADAPCWRDVADFERLIAHDSATGSRRKVLQEAVGLYGGELLEGSEDEWLLGDRERLRRMYLEALAELADLCETQGATAEAIAHTERLMRLDPLSEQSYRRLMRLHSARGDRARALTVYHDCSTTLERELGVEVSGHTRAAYEALLDQGQADQVAPERAPGPQLVGRAPERARLIEMWTASDDGRAQLALVTGESGVGKTRLVEELRDWCSRRGVATADARCYPAEGSLAYGPVAAWLRSAALRPRLRLLDATQLSEVARLLPELLVDLPGVPRPTPLPESDQRRLLFDAVSSVVLRGGPVMLVLDDLQHADRQTGRLLHYLLRVQPGARLLVVATARREEIAAGHPAHELIIGLQARECFTELALDRLSPTETRTLAKGLSTAPITEADLQRLYAETEGNALFVVEALRAGWAADQPLSPRVQAVIAARLDQLSSPARALVEVASTIGREFTTDVLTTAADTAEDVLVRGLDELWRRRIVRDVGPDTYDFSHGRIREVAYLGLSPARRRLLHRRVAGALEPSGDGAAATIAAHYERAGMASQAIPWYRRAAESAQLLHAYSETVRLLERGLDLVGSQAVSAGRDASELQLQTALLPPLVMLATYSSPVLSAAQKRALELSRRLGQDPSPPLLRSLALSALTRDHFTAAARYGHDLRAAGENASDDSLVVEAEYVLGVSTFWQADFDTARRHFELALHLYRPDNRLDHIVRFSQDPKVVCLGRLANTLWFLGRPADAVAARAATLAWAEEIEHPFSSAIAFTFAALLALDMGDDDAVREYTQALTSASREAVSQHVAAAFGGYVAVLDGDVDGGIAAIQASVERACDDAAAPGQAAFMVRVLLAARLACGDERGALAAADHLLDMRGAACVWEKEARRVHAELAQL